PGYRRNDTGDMLGVANGGYNWSSTTIGTDSFHLNFRINWLYDQRIDHRAFGFQLRCLSE
ncbi:hypothetical protein, partial [uncultured Rikenella sp.]|uniref:hypothetical protein n=1 Tax=uncultured Rikenella sp. TaxID=368003 RepID=UPI0025DEDB61